MHIIKQSWGKTKILTQNWETFPQNLSKLSKALIAICPASESDRSIRMEPLTAYQLQLKLFKQQYCTGVSQEPCLTAQRVIWSFDRSDHICYMYLSLLHRPPSINSYGAGLEGFMIWTGIAWLQANCWPRTYNCWPRTFHQKEQENNSWNWKF